jgi:hypothetical protein
MSNPYRRCTAIIFDGDSNLQLNFEGFKQKLLTDFETACTNRGAVWGRLLDWRTGDLTASFSSEGGLQLSEPNVTSGAPLADVLGDYMSDYHQARIAEALIAGIREIEFTPAQYAHLTKYVAELGENFLPKQQSASDNAPGGMG